MIVVGIDPSTKTGLAAVNGKGKVVASKEIVYSPSKTKGVIRATDIAQEVIDFCDKHKPKLVVIEGYAFGNKFTLVTMVEIGTMIRYKLQGGSQIKSYHWIELQPTALKKFVTGKGNSKKDMMMKEVYKKWGFEGTDNECDAVGLAMYGLSLQEKGN